MAIIKHLLPREKKSPDDPITANEIREAIRNNNDNYNKIFVPEFTFDKYRADAIIINIGNQMITGFEIKVKRGDWLGDRKYHHYTKFCSSIVLVSPHGVIKKKEVKDPFGLVRATRNADGVVILNMIKKPKRIQTHEALAWTWTYTRVCELEIRRLAHENRSLKWSNTSRS